MVIWSHKIPDSRVHGANMGPTWVLLAPRWAPWTLLSGMFNWYSEIRFLSCVSYLCLSLCHAGSLLWRHNGRDGVLSHQPQDCLLNRLFRRRSKKTSKFRVTGLCARNSPVNGEFPTQMASNAGNVSISWHHHVFRLPIISKRAWDLCVK